MEIYVFTIRNKIDNTLIYAEGAQDHHYFSNFRLNEKWLTEEDLTNRNKAWYQIDEDYSFDEEIRHLFHYEYDLVKFSLETVDFN